MQLDHFIGRVPHYYEAGLSINLKGPIGRGKSSVIINDAPKSLAAAHPGKTFGVVVMNGPLLTPPDTIGYGTPQRIKRVEEHLMMVFTEPFWWLTAEGKHISEFDGGIIVVEEEDKMDTDVKKVMGEAALSKRLGPHVLPPGWLVWFTSNRAEDRSGSTKNYDHLINRQMIINVDDSIDASVKWMTATGVHPLFIHFATQYPHIYFQEQPKQQVPFCTPRSFDETARYVADVINKGRERIEIDALTQEEVAGKIGTGAASQLVAHVLLQEDTPPFEDVVKDPMGAKLPSRADAAMLMVFQCASRVAEDNIDPVVQYIERMPPEFTITFAKNAIGRNPKLIYTPAFAAWTRRNSQLMMAIA